MKKSSYGAIISNKFYNSEIGVVRVQVSTITQNNYYVRKTQDDELIDSGGFLVFRNNKIENHVT